MRQRSAAFGTKSENHRPHSTCRKNNNPVFGQASYDEPLIARFSHPEGNSHCLHNDTASAETFVNDHAFQRVFAAVSAYCVPRLVSLRATNQRWHLAATRRNVRLRRWMPNILRKGSSPNGRDPTSRSRDLRGSVTPAKAGGVEPGTPKPDASRYFAAFDSDRGTRKEQHTASATLDHGLSGMDAFEQLVSEILWMEGYWVRTSVKVKLTPAEKRQIGRASSPRWELDIVAYSARDNVLKVIECKSYLDSRGVKLHAFDGSNDKSAKRFKLFTENKLRRIVLKRLRLQFAETGACRTNSEVKLCLASGRIATDTDRTGLHKHFAKKGWELWDEDWLRERIKRMADPKESYENQVSAVVAKLLLRKGQVTANRRTRYDAATVSRMIAASG